MRFTWCTGHSGVIEMMAQQLGLAMMPRCVRSAARLISGTTSGTCGSMRKAEELSITVAPACTASGAKRFEVALPAENNATSTPWKLSAPSSRTVSCSPRNGSCLPAERAEANSRSSAKGWLRCSRQCSSSTPTAPVAPTIANTGARRDGSVIQVSTQRTPRLRGARYQYHKRRAGRRFPRTTAVASCNHEVAHWARWAQYATRRLLYERSHRETPGAQGPARPGVARPHRPPRVRHLVPRKAGRPVRAGPAGGGPDHPPRLRARALEGGGAEDGARAAVQLHLASLRNRPGGRLLGRDADAGRVPPRAHRGRHAAGAHRVGFRQSARRPPCRGLPHERRRLERADAEHHRPCHAARLRAVSRCAATTPRYSQRSATKRAWRWSQRWRPVRPAPSRSSRAAAGSPARQSPSTCGYWRASASCAARAAAATACSSSIRRRLPRCRSIWVGSRSSGTRCWGASSRWSRAEWGATQLTAAAAAGTVM